MTIAETLAAVVSPLSDWVETKGGSCEVATGPAHLFALLAQKPGGLKLCVMLGSQTKRGEFEESGMVDETFLVVVHRQAGFKLRKGDNLTEGAAGGDGLFDLIEELRDLVRGIDFTIDETEWTADYRGLTPYQWPWAEQMIDAWQLEFSLGKQLPVPTSP